MQQVKFQANIILKIQSKEVHVEQLTERDVLHIVAEFEQYINGMQPISIGVPLEDMPFNSGGSGTPGPVFDLYPRYHFKAIAHKDEI